MDIRTDRLVVHPLLLSEVENLARWQKRDNEVWAKEYPSFSEVELFEGYIAENRHRHIATSTLYQIRLKSTAMAFGIVGVMHTSDPLGRKDFGFGIAVSMRKQGFASEAALAVVEAEKDQGALGLVASAPIHQREAHVILARCGFVESSRDEDSLNFAVNFHR